MTNSLRNVKIITFYTEGLPEDGGLSLKSSAYTLASIIRSEGYSFQAYTPSLLRKIGAYELTNSYPSSYCLPQNPGLHKIGFSAWKPFIILHAMQDLEPEDFVFYIDCNIVKYPMMRGYIKNLKNIILQGLNNFDFSVARENSSQDLKSFQFSNMHQITEIAGDDEFTRGFPMLIVNNIIVKNTDKGKLFLLHWLALCRQKRFILPPMHDEEYDGFRWFCPEQSICNMLIIRYIKDGELAWFYPNFSCGRDGIVRSVDNSHVALLNTTQKPKNPLGIQFFEEILDTQDWINNVFSRRFSDNLGWIEINQSIYDWKASDNASIEHTSDGSIIFREGDNHDFQLMNLQNDDFHGAEIRLNFKVKPLSGDDTWLYINHWGAIDICKISSDGRFDMGGLCVNIERNEEFDGFVQYSIQFCNFNHFLAIGSARYSGNHQGDGQDKFIFRDISVHIRKLASLSA